MSGSIGSIGSSATFASMQKMQEKRFNEIDTDGDGKITKDELATALSKKKGKGNGPSVDEIMDTLDTDKDGTISKAESAAGAEKMMKKYGPPPPPPSSDTSSSSNASSSDDLYQTLIDALNKAKDKSASGTDASQSNNAIQNILQIFASAIESYEKQRRRQFLRDLR